MTESSPLRRSISSMSSSRERVGRQGVVEALHADLPAGLLLAGDVDRGAGVVADEDRREARARAAELRRERLDVARHGRSARAPAICLPSMISAGSRTDLDGCLRGHLGSFVIGAYSAMSLRSLPSPAKRTTTIPPASIPVTTPAPNAACVTSSPSRKSTIGAASRAAVEPTPTIPAAAAAAPDRAATAPRAASLARSVSSYGISSRKRERIPYCVAPKTARRRALVRYRLAHRPRDADVGEAALLLQAALVERARVREDALLHAGEEHDRVLEALGVVERHERDEALVVGARVGVGDERDALQEDVERACSASARGVELARDLDELGEVLLAALRLDRALGLQRVDVAGVVESASSRSPIGTCCSTRSRSAVIVCMKLPNARTAALPRPGTARGVAAASQTRCPSCGRAR